MAKKDVQIPINISEIECLARSAADRNTGESFEQARQRIITGCEEVGMKIDYIPEDSKGNLDFSGIHKFGFDIAKPSGTPTPKS